MNHDLSAETIAQLLRLYSAKPYDSRRPIPLARLAAASCISRRAIYLARKGYISERTRRLLSAGIAVMRKELQVGRPAHHDLNDGSDLDALSLISFARIFRNDINGISSVRNS